MAVEMVWMDGRGRRLPVRRYSGTVSFLLVAARKDTPVIPIALARRPAARLPKFPDGTEIRIRFYYRVLCSS